MRYASWLAAAFLLLSHVSARCDTVTLKNNLSVNGSIVAADNEFIKLNARFESGTRTMQYRIDSIQTIEFNSNTYNSGPPRVLGIAPGKSPAAPPAQVVAGAVIVLRGNDRRACKLLKIDENRVYCDPPDGNSASSYGRSTVLRISLE